MTPRRRAVSRVSRLARAEAPIVRRATPAEALTRTPAEAAVAVAAKRAARVAAIPADVAKKLQDGKLEQACPDCGRWEAAGSYCSGCDRPMGPDDWYGNGDLTRRAVARHAATEKAQTRGKRPRGRPRAELDSPGLWPA